MFKSTLLLLCLCKVVLSAPGDTTIRYAWNYPNYNWPSQEEYTQSLSNGNFIPVNNPITGIKVWKERVYLSMPRWRKGVPVTLGRVAAGHQLNPLLEPYPNWAWQRLDDCQALQYVQSMEIDPNGRMWILDNGRTEFLGEQKTKCDARLVVIDLETDRELLEHRFPPQVVNRESVFLNDIVVDHEDGGYAYITDHDAEDPGIVVFSLKSRKSWKVRDPTMLFDPAATTLRINGTTVKNKSNLDGIALSPASTEGARVLYYTPLASYEIFAVPTSALRSGAGTIQGQVSLLGRKSSQTDGMITDALGRLYYGLLTENEVQVWDSQCLASQTNRRTVFRDPNVNQWPDTFAIDEHGSVWWTSNRLQRFVTNVTNINETNYRVLVSETNGDKGYQYYSNGTKPILPTI